MTDLYFIPQPQRCAPLAAAAAVGPESPVVLCAPAQDGAYRSEFSDLEYYTKEEIERHKSLPSAFRWCLPLL